MLCATQDAKPYFAAESRSADVFDDLDELVQAETLAAGEVDELFRSLDDSALARPVSSAIRMREHRFKSNRVEPGRIGCICIFLPRIRTAE